MVSYVDIIGLAIPCSVANLWEIYVIWPKCHVRWLRWLCTIITFIELVWNVCIKDFWYTKYIYFCSYVFKRDEKLLIKYLQAIHKHHKKPNLPPINIIFWILQSIYQSRASYSQNLIVKWNWGISWSNFQTILKIRRFIIWISPLFLVFWGF